MQQIISGGLIGWLLNPGSRLSQRTLNATIWTFGSKGIGRLLGYARIIILARLLTPQDFGLMGIGLVVLGVLYALTQPGLNEALVQKKGGINEYLDTLWTVTIYRTLLIVAIMALGAPFLAAFFNAPDTRLIIQIIAVAVLLSGFRNPGILHYQKDLQFQKKFVIETLPLIVEMVTVVTLAAVYRSVWALVLGFFARALADVIVSYWLHPYRPRFRARKGQAKELFVFGRWVYLSRVVNFVSDQAGALMLAAQLGPATLGFYQMAERTTVVPLQEAIRGVTAVAFPVYSKVQSSAAKLHEVFLRSLEGVTSLSLPLIVAVVILAQDFVTLVLGEKWSPAVPAIQALAIAAFLQSLTGMGVALFMGAGRPQISFQTNLLRAVALAASIYPMVNMYGLVGATYAILIGNSASFALFSFHLLSSMNIRVAGLLKSLLPALVISTCAGATLLAVKGALNPLDHLDLLGAVGLVFLVYLVAVVGLWRLFHAGPVACLIALKSGGFSEGTKQKLGDARP